MRHTMKDFIWVLETNGAAAPFNLDSAKTTTFGVLDDVEAMKSSSSCSKSSRGLVIEPQQGS
jgi:hypothetical protein